MLSWHKLHVLIFGSQSYGVHGIRLSFQILFRMASITSPEITKSNVPSVHFVLKTFCSKCPVSEGKDLLSPKPGENNEGFLPS